MQPDEAPYELLVYIWDDPATGRADIDDGLVQSALSDIHRRGDIDVVDLSFGAQWGGDAAGLGGNIGHYKAKFQALTDRTLVVISAGNNGADSVEHSPSAIVLDPDVKNVMSIAAVAVANSDRTSRTSRRTGPVRPRSSPRCRAEPATALPASATRSRMRRRGITLAARGRICWPRTRTATRSSPAHRRQRRCSREWRAFSRRRAPPTFPVPPASIKDILVRTADDITERWDTPAPDGTPERMRRVNALAAVPSNPPVGPDPAHAHQRRQPQCRGAGPRDRDRDRSGRPGCADRVRPMG